MQIILGEEKRRAPNKSHWKKREKGAPMQAGRALREMGPHHSSRKALLRVRTEKNVERNIGVTSRYYTTTNKEEKSLLTKAKLSG